MAVPHSATTARFWDACDEHRLILRHCVVCDRCFYYPRTGCPFCGSEDLDWRPSGGTGTIYSYSHVEMALGGPAWEAETPYTVILVDLDEGVRFTSRLVGHGRGDVRIGDRVSVTFVERDGQSLPCFALSR